MQINKVETQNAPAAIGPYSQAIVVGDFVYTSGQLGLDPKTGAFVEGGVKEQTQQALKNVEAVLKQAGTSMGKVVKTTVFVANMDDFAIVNEVYSKAFEGCENFPARSCVQVSKLPKGGLVEIEVVAVK